MKKFISTLLTGALLLVPTPVSDSHKYAEVRQTETREVSFDFETVAYNVVYESVQLPLESHTEEEVVPEEQEVEKKYSAFYIVNTPLNTRETPSTEFEPIGHLPKYHPVKGIDRVNGWVELENGSFVNGKYLNEKPGMTLEEFDNKVAQFKVEKAKLAEKKKQVKPSKKEVKHSTTRKGININSSERELLARLVRAEAGGESYEGMVAVASVVLNRVASSKFPNDIRGVIYAKNQFSPVANGSINKKALDIQYKAVDDALHRDNTKGALFFYAPSLVKSRYMESLRTVAVIGTHHFKVN